MPKQIEIEETNNGYLVTVTSPSVSVYVYKFVEEKELLNHIAKYLFDYKLDVKRK